MSFLLSNMVPTNNVVLTTGEGREAGGVGENM
jgi:hypothetical protein